MTDPSPSPIQTTGQTSSKPPKPKKRRRLILWIMGLPAVLFVGLIILASTGALTGAVVAIIEKETGLDVVQGRVVLTLTTEIELRDAVLRAPDIPGLGGEIIRLDKATISMNWGSILSGPKAIKAILIERPHLRVSQDTATGAVNLDALILQQSGGGGAATPAITINKGIIEIGEHTGDQYTRLKELSVVGSLAKPDASGIAQFNFSATSAQPSMSSPDSLSRAEFMITGTVVESGIEGTMTGLKLEDWPADIVPSRVRDRYELLALSGQLAATRFRIIDGQPEVVLTLDGVDLNLPFNPEGGFEGPTQFLRMRSTQGTMTFGHGGLNADLTGDIDGLLYEVDLTIDEYSEDSPFTCDLRTKFRIQEGFKPLMFLPGRVSEKLDRFVGLKADIDATINIKRSRDSEEAGSIAVSGTAKITNGSAKYEKFMYPFENLTGTISFTPDGVQIENITGNAPSGAKIRTNGYFNGLGEHSVVKIVIDVDSLPIDQTLLGAMDDDQRDLVDTLFSRKKYDHLIDSGYLITQTRRQELAKNQKEILDAIGKLSGDTSSQIRKEMSSELAQIQKLLAVPEFDFGGLIGVQVTLRRHPEKPKDDRWTTDIDARIPRAGIVPKHFPLPIVASNVEITIEDGNVFLSGGQYDGLGGGQASVEASFKPRDGFDGRQPYVDIKARGIPIDQRLIAAIPSYYDPEPADPNEITLRRILDRLQLQGVVEVDAEIFARDDGEIGYRVEAGILSGSAHPLSMGSQIRSDQAELISHDLGMNSVQINEMMGTIYVTESLIVVDLAGKMESPSQPIPPTPLRMFTQLTLPKEPRFGGIKRINGMLPFEAGPPIPGPAVITRVSAQGLDLAMPLEHAISVISPTLASRVVQWRQEYLPDGVLDIQADLEGRVGGSLNTRLQTNRIETLGFSFEDHRYELGASIGSLAMDIGIRPKVDCRGFMVPVKIDQRSAGTLTLDGSMKLARGGQLLEASDEPSLKVEIQRGQLGSPGVLAAVDWASSGDENDGRDGGSGGSGENGGKGGARGFFEYYGLDGAFDLLIDISPVNGARISKAPPGTYAMPPVSIDGELTPLTLSMQRDGNRLEFDEIIGSIIFDGLEGSFDQIVATKYASNQNQDSDNTTGEPAEIIHQLSVDGRWAITLGAGAWLDVEVGAVGDVLGGPMRVVLPETLLSVVDQLQVQSTGGVNLQRLHINADLLGTRSPIYNIHGSATVLGASALVGMQITELDGQVDFSVITDDSPVQDSNSAPRKLQYKLDLHAPMLRAGLLRMHNARAKIINDPDTIGVVLVPELYAGMHGGMVSGNAQIRPDETSETGKTGALLYSTEIRCSGVRAAPIFDDLFLPPEGLVGPPRPGAMRVRSAWNIDSDVSKGVMNADLAISGPIGVPEERYGRGYVRVSGGSVIALPGIINLIEASNLALPTGSRLNLAEAELYIDGNTMAFERLSASSDAIEILGYGTMDWISREIDLRFRSRSIKPIPILSSLLEGIRDELITIRIVGAPGSITYAPEQFGSVRRLLDSMFGSAETEQQRRLRKVQGDARANLNRSLGIQNDRVELPSTLGVSSVQIDENVDE